MRESFGLADKAAPPPCWRAISFRAVSYLLFLRAPRLGRVPRPARPRPSGWRSPRAIPRRRQDSSTCCRLAQSACEVSQLDLPLAGYEARASRQLYPHFDGPGEFLVDCYPGYMRRQVTGVLDDQLDTTEPSVELLCLQAGQQARGRGRMREGETSQLLALRSEEFGRRILGCELGPPAPQLHASELRVVEGSPGDEAITSQLPVVPREHLQRRLFGRLAEELDKVRHLYTGGLRHGPELDGKGEDAVGIVSPIVEGAGYGLLRVVAEVVVDGDVRVACDPCAPLAKRLENSEVVLGHLVVWPVGVRPQDRPAERMVGVHAEDVLVPEQEIDLRPRLRL